jgi:hypothetical protein
MSIYRVRMSTGRMMAVAAPPSLDTTRGVLSTGGSRLVRPFAHPSLNSVIRQPNHSEAADPQPVSFKPRLIGPSGSAAGPDGNRIPFISIQSYWGYEARLSLTDLAFLFACASRSRPLVASKVKSRVQFQRFGSRDNKSRICFHAALNVRFGAPSGRRCIVDQRADLHWRAALGTLERASKLRDTMLALVQSGFCCIPFEIRVADSWSNLGPLLRYSAGPHAPGSLYSLKSCRSLVFSSLPVAVCGSSATKATSSGIHHFATLPL